MLGHVLFLAVVSVLVDAQVGQGSDGNPHGWDRRRRCDQQGYEPPCGVCEGYGGIPTGDENNQIKLTTCEAVGNATEIKAGVRPKWGGTFTVPYYNEILIGPKTDPFCLNSFPSNSSAGKLCYRPDSGRQVSDMKGSKAMRLDLESKTEIGNLSSTIIHQGTNMWIVNKLPWYAAGVHQCICTHVHQGSDQQSRLLYPVQFNWTNNLIFVGREKIGIEYMDPGHVEELDHWSFGPHHAWSVPDSGEIRRLWQPFNGLEVFPQGMSNTSVDENLFNDIPPALCKKEGGAALRIHCTDDGFPVENSTSSSPTTADLVRAKTRTPRAPFRGDTFTDMSSTLNRWVKNGKHTKGRTKSCEEWTVDELQELQSFLYYLKDYGFQKIYQEANDNRRIKKDILELQQDWNATKALLSSWDAHKNEKQNAAAINRDGHCHEALMWYTHHLTSDLKHMLADLPDFTVPLLSSHSHAEECQAWLAVSPHESVKRVCKNYLEQVTCASCHSNAPPNHRFLFSK